MGTNSRIKNLILNVSVGFFSQIGMLLLSFIGRTIFVLYLNQNYLGINGLYSNILSILALAELGIGSVAQFYLYRPVAENNQILIKSLISFFKKMYLLIALVIFTAGILMIPLLKYIVNSNLPIEKIRVYYVVFLLNTVISYFSAHKVVLLAAYQNIRVQKFLLLFTNFLNQVFQIIVLIFWKSYELYISITLLTTIINVISVNLITNKKYSYLKKKNQVKIGRNLKNEIKNRMKSTFVYKIGATLINNTDNILISMLVNTTAVGLYSNYCMIVNAVQSFISIITVSLITTIGNLSIDSTKEKINRVFNLMVLCYQLIAVFGGVSFYFLLNDFIFIWIGEKYLLSDLSVAAIVLNFYLTNAISPIWMFREANGLFDKVKYLLLVTAIVNILLSFIFGIWFGTVGILMATFVARIVTQVWYEPYVLHKYIFNTTVKTYWKNQMWYVFLALLTFICCYKVNSILGHNFISIIIRVIYFAIIEFTIFITGNLKKMEFREIIKYIKSKKGIKK